MAVDRNDQLRFTQLMFDAVYSAQVLRLQFDQENLPRCLPQIDFVGCPDKVSALKWSNYKEHKILRSNR